MSSRRHIRSFAVFVSVLGAIAAPAHAQPPAPPHGQLQLVDPRNTTLSCMALPPVAGAPTPESEPTYICRPVAATATAGAAPITATAEPLPARPGPTREKAVTERSADARESRSSAPLYIGAAIGAGIGAVGGGVLGNLAHGLGGIDCESNCDYDSTDETLGFALGGMVVGGLVGLGVGAIAWAAGAGDSKDEVKSASGAQREPKAVSKLAPVLSISSDGTGAFAGVKGAF